MRYCIMLDADDRQHRALFLVALIILNVLIENLT